MDLVNGTLADAVAALADAAAAARCGGVVKLAAVPDVLSGLGTAMQNNPMLGQALIGGGVGAGLGGLATAYNNAGQPAQRKKSLLGGALTGGLAGAGVGAGVGLARQGIAGMGGGQGVAHGDALQPGEFTVPGQGGGPPTRMRIDPKALKDNPGLPDQVRKLTTPTFQTDAAGAVTGLLNKIREQTPTMSSVAPWLVGADAAMHAPIPGLGWARTTADRVGGHAGRKFLDLGLEGAGDDIMPENMRAAIQGNAPLGGGPGGSTVTSHVGTGHTLGDRLSNWLNRRLGRPENQPNILDILGRRGGPGIGDRPVAEVSYPKTEPVEQTQYHPNPDGTPDRGRPYKKTVQSPVLDAAGNPVTAREGATEGHIGSAKTRGAAKDEYFKDRNIFKVPGMQKYYRGAPSVAHALGGRAAGLAGLFGGEYVMRGMAEDVSKRKALEELAAQYAKPVPGK